LLVVNSDGQSHDYSYGVCNRHHVDVAHWHRRTVTLLAAMTAVEMQTLHLIPSPDATAIAVAGFHFRGP